MKQIIKKLSILYIIIVLIKIIMSYFISSPTGFWDEYIYIKLGRSIYYSNSLSLTQNTPSQFYPPIYPFVISFLYFLKDMNLIYFGIKIINSIISTLVIIPSYLLSKEFLDEKQAFYTTALISIIPITFSFSYYILAENLFYPLFLFSIYFIYKTLKEDSKKYHIIASIFISLSFLTKNLGLILIPVYLFSYILKKPILKEKLNLKNLLIGLITVLLLISPWLIRNYLSFGHGVEGVLEDTAKDNLEAILGQRETPYILPFINWAIIYIISLSISSGLLFFFSSFFILKNVNNNTKYFLILSLVTISLYILVLSNNSVGIQNNDLPKIFQYFTDRPITRYTDILVPFVIILGTLGLNNYKKEPNKKTLKKLIYISLPFYIISSQLTLASLFPINNPSLTYIGLTQKFIDFLINKSINFGTEFNIKIFIIMASLFLFIPFIAYLIDKLDINIIKYLIFSFFIILSLLNFSVTHYKSEQWSKNELIELGIWFNNNIKETSNVLFDIRSGGNPFNNSKALFQAIKEKQYQPQYVSFAAFWMNHNLFFDSIENKKDINYIITNYDLNNYILVKQTNNFKIYKI